MKKNQEAQGSYRLPEQQFHFQNSLSKVIPQIACMMGQRWQTVVPLAVSWRWVHNVGPTLGQHHHVLHKNWKATPFRVLALQRRAANAGPSCTT